MSIVRFLLHAFGNWQRFANIVLVRIKMCVFRELLWS